MKSLSKPPYQRLGDIWTSKVNIQWKIDQTQIALKQMVTAFQNEVQNLDDRQINAIISGIDKLKNIDQVKVEWDTILKLKNDTNDYGASQKSVWKNMGLYPSRFSFGSGSFSPMNVPYFLALQYSAILIAWYVHTYCEDQGRKDEITDAVIDHSIMGYLQKLSFPDEKQNDTVAYNLVMINSRYAKKTGLKFSRLDLGYHQNNVLLPITQTEDTRHVKDFQEWKKNRTDYLSKILPHLKDLIEDQDLDLGTFNVLKQKYYDLWRELDEYNHHKDFGADDWNNISLQDMMQNMEVDKLNDSSIQLINWQ